MQSLHLWQPPKVPSPPKKKKPSLPNLWSWRRKAWRGAVFYIWSISFTDDSPASPSTPEWIRRELGEIWWLNITLTDPSRLRLGQPATLCHRWVWQWRHQAQWRHYPTEMHCVTWFSCKAIEKNNGRSMDGTSSSAVFARKVIFSTPNSCMQYRWEPGMFSRCTRYVRVLES